MFIPTAIRKHSQSPKQSPLKCLGRGAKWKCWGFHYEMFLFVWEAVEEGGGGSPVILIVWEEGGLFKTRPVSLGTVLFLKTTLQICRNARLA